MDLTKAFGYVRQLESHNPSFFPNSNSNHDQKDEIKKTLDTVDLK